MNILLLGGTGTISKAVLFESLRKGINVSILNRGSNNKNLPKEVEVLVADIHSMHMVRKTLGERKYDVIIDFLSRKPSDIDETYSEMAGRCKQYIFISTCCVFEREQTDFPIKESSPKPNKKWSYNIEKYEAERKLIELSISSECYYTIVRPYITYDERRIPYGLAPDYRYHRTIIERVKEGKPLLLWNDGYNEITITQSADFAKYLVGLFLNPQSFNEDFNLVSDYIYSYREIVECLCKKLNVPVCWIKVNVDDIIKFMPEDEQLMLGDRRLNAIFDNSKLKKAVPNLNFNNSLEKGLDIIIDYYIKTKEYKYDYRYDALIDRIASYASSRKYSYIKYKGSSIWSIIEYVLFRYFPYRYAQRIFRFFSD